MQKINTMKLKLFLFFAFICSLFSFGQTFYLVGGASAAGWDSGNALDMYQRDNITSLNTYLTNGESFRFLGQKDWSPINYSLDVPNIRLQYRFFKTSSNNITTTSADDENMKFTGATGYYKIVINSDFAAKTLNIIQQPAIYNNNLPELYLVGSMQAWDPSTAIVIPSDPSGTGKYKAYINIPDGCEFKILGQKDWGDIEYGNLGGLGYSGFLGYKGDNDNFKVNGGGKFYSVEIDLRRGTLKIPNLEILATENIIVKSKIKFSPNPAKDKIIFDKEVKAFSIYDLSGKLVQISNIKSNELYISNLKSGNYILKISTENGDYTEKLVKE